MRRFVVPAVGVATGLGVAAVAGRRARLRPDGFYASYSPDATPWEGGGVPVILPITYHRSEQVISLHPVSLEAARAALPTDGLHPVRLPDGRALMAVSAARYLEGTAPGVDPHDLRYGEVMVALMVTQAPSPPLVPIVRAMLPGGGPTTLGAFLLHVAVSNRAARDVARSLGFPAFVGDFAFEDGLDERRVSLSDGGREILRLRVASAGRVFVDRRPTTTYSVLGDRLLGMVSPCSGVAQQRLGRGAGTLALGDHPVAESIRALDPSLEALVTRSYLNLRIRFLPPRVVGGARPQVGYAGSDRARGTYTLGYPDGSVIDLHEHGDEVAPMPGPAPLSRRRRSPASAG
jgi:hypothetical protein